MVTTADIGAIIWPGQISDAKVVDKLLSIPFIVKVAHAHNLNTPIFVLVPQGIEFRRFAVARAAPTGPEVDHHHFASLLAERKATAIIGFDSEIGRGVIVGYLEIVVAELDGKYSDYSHNNHCKQE